MNPLVLVDTGPLVAMRNERDADHARCLAALKSLPRPLLTCWPVLTEATYLLRHYPRQVRELLLSADGQFLRVLPLRYPDVQAINAVLEKYEDQALQLADAALIHLAERENVSRIFSLDRRDFSVLRTASGAGLQVIPD